MISNFNVVMMYLIGGLEILLPLTVLLIVYRYKSFALSSVVAGFACYFLLNSTLINGIISVILVRLDDPFYFNDHKMLGVLVESGMTAILVTPVMYLILSKLRKGKWSLYDAAALGVSYWLVPLFSNAAILISQGSIGRIANQGRLEELVNENYTLEALESLVDTLAAITPAQMFGQLFYMLVSKGTTVAVAVGLGFMVYYAVKRKKVSILLLSVVVNFICMVLMYGSESIIGYWGAFAVTAVMGIGALFFIRSFLQFYRRQQAELLRRKQAYKEELRAKAAAEREAKQKENQ